MTGIKPTLMQSSVAASVPSRGSNPGDFSAGEGSATQKLMSLLHVQCESTPLVHVSTLTTHSLTRACPMLPQASKMAENSRHRRGHLVGGGRARFRLEMRAV